jgi:hypothetical protein
MARRSSGLKTAFKVIKAIDRAAKQSDRDRQRRVLERDRAEKAAARQELQRDRQNARAEAQALKDEFQTAQEIYEDRVVERRVVKEEVINQYMR